jgi:hypothetical protein
MSKRIRKTKAEILLGKEICEKELLEVQAELKRTKKALLTLEKVKREIFKISNMKPRISQWVHAKSALPGKSTVVPVVQLSDAHYGETVEKDQVFGVNEYNLRIASERMRLFGLNTVGLLKENIRLNYPGIVLCLNGDLLSGNIHEELIATNDVMVMPAFLKLFDDLASLLRLFVTEFGRVLVTATAGGNHTRMTKRIPAKSKAFTNFDWLMYRLLEKVFRHDRRVNFLISDGDDLEFQIYGHRYRQTHGDQFRGGTGFIGPFAPITRSETKKRTAAASYNRPYDTLIIGHFHQLMFLPSVIVNGSLVGYNEFALRINAPFEEPRQALWLNHREWGITGRYPVFCREKVPEKKEVKKKTWWGDEVK